MKGQIERTYADESSCKKSRRRESQYSGEETIDPAEAIQNANAQCQRYAEDAVSGTHIFVFEHKLALLSLKLSI